MSLRRTLVGAVVLATALFAGTVAAADDGAPAAADDAAQTVRDGAHYRVVCHFAGGDGIAEKALAAAEAAWESAARRVRERGDQAPDAPIEIHLYATGAAYQAAEQKLTGGKFAQSFAFSSHGTRFAYLALQPDQCAAVRERTGISSLTLRQVAHEAAHLVLYWTLRNFADHPAWFAEGFATAVAEEVMVGKGWSPGAEDDPLSSGYMVSARRLLEEGRLPDVATILSDSMPELSAQETYAVWWLFYRFLESPGQAPRLAKTLARVRSQGGGPTFAARLLDFMRKTWTQSAFAALDAEFREYLSGLSPQWDEVLRTLDARGDEWTQLGFSDTNAIAWRTAPVARTAYTVSGSVEILPAEKTQMNLLLGRNADGFVSIALAAGSGVTIFDFHAASGEWENVGWLDVPDLVVGAAVPFRVRLDGPRIFVTVGATDELSWDLHGRDMQGAWGVGAQNASAGIWRGVRVE